MKKLLVLLLVLGMASGAHAALDLGLVFTLNGEPQPDEIVLRPSESIELDLELLQGNNILGYTLDYVLSDPAGGDVLAEFLVDGIKFPTVFSFPGSAIVGDNRVTITAAQFLVPAVEGPGVLMHDLYIHCLGEGNVMLDIIAQAGTTINGDPIQPGTIVHSLSIIQIPEPATMVLLGLGGLLLRKRK